jgi:hypothetical protein
VLQVGDINGIKAATISAAGPNATVALFVGAGSANETAETAGSAKLLEYMAFKVWQEAGGGGGMRWPHLPRSPSWRSRLRRALGSCPGFAAAWLQARCVRPPARIAGHRQPHHLPPDTRAGEVRCSHQRVRR